MSDLPPFLQYMMNQGLPRSGKNVLKSIVSINCKLFMARNISSPEPLGSWVSL